MSAQTSDSDRQFSLKPLSTELASVKSVDSAVALSAQSDATKSGGDPGSTLPTDEMLQREEVQTATPLIQDGLDESSNQQTDSDIADLVRSLQRVLSNSKANVSVNIDSTASTRSAEALTARNTQPPGDLALAENSRDNKGDDTHQPSKDAQKNPMERKAISYAVEYLDMFSQFVSKDIRTTEYDLESELQKTNSERYSSAFTVTTVIRTSLAPSEIRVFPSDKDEPKKDGPLKNKDVTMGLYTVRLTITSPAILDVLRKNAFYYPDLAVWNDQLTLTSPFSALAHHLSLLEEERDRLKASPSIYPTVHREQDQPVTPVEYQCRSAIPNTDAVEHLTLLLQYLGKAYEKRIEDEKRRNSKGRCTFSMLWYLFRPGMTVYVQSDNAEDPPSAMVVHSVTVDPGILYRHNDKPDPCSLDLWYLDFDGDYIERRYCVQNIESFDGEKQITDLRVIPSQFTDEKDKQKTRDENDFVTTKDHLVKLGRKWFDLLKGKMVLYKGQIPDGPDTDAFNGRVYVDCASYWNTQGGQDAIASPSLQYYTDRTMYPQSLDICSCPECKLKTEAMKRGPFDEFIWIDPNSTKSLELDEKYWDSKMNIDRDHRYLLCSHTLGGLALKNRKWERLNVAYCSDIEPKAKAIDNLVMKSSRKEMIKSLLYNYSNTELKDAPKPWSADFIENKGDGRIILLHGPPGVGKTYTAECIAEYTGRPLLSLTCGDIGTTEQVVETNLWSWFTLGERWGAVVLIDEADVYLESRKPGDVKRNGLVSVFLRAVEYYKGILFLTTNRVGQFDDAFVSRIHVVLRYERLGPEERKLIWEGFFQKLQRERGNQIRISKQAREYVLTDKEMVDIPWNGREIRNAFQTAVALAQYKFATSEDKEDGDKAVLDRDHFEEVCNMAMDFKQYLKTIHGKDESGRAMRGKNYVEMDNERSTEAGTL